MFSHSFWWPVVYAQILIARVRIRSNSGNLSSVLVRRNWSTAKPSGFASFLLVLLLATLISGCSAYTKPSSPSNVYPAITMQPASETVTTGQTASFGVTATGAAPLSYQWQKNGTAIAGATSSSYTTPATTSADNGAQFTVVVSNTAGNATSNAATLTVNATSPSTVAVWTAPSLERVGTTDAPDAASAINLFGARGETVDTQVVVRAPAGGLTNVNLNATALAGPNGVTIPASEVTLYREEFITVTGTASYGGGSNPPLGSGTYPEPLIPFNDPQTGAALCASSAVLKACNATVSSGQNQPYWIAISIPHGSATAPPGTYTGSIKVTADQGMANVPVTVTVCNFELPVQPSELTLWTLWSPATGNTSASLSQALMRNKLMTWNWPAVNSASDVSNMVLNRSGLDSYYVVGIQCNGSYNTMPTTSQLNAAAANFPSALGLDLYLADELNGCTGSYNAIKTMGANAHAADRSVKTMVTLDAADLNLYGAVDHWVLLASAERWPLVPFTGGGDLLRHTSRPPRFSHPPAR